PASTPPDDLRAIMPPLAPSPRIGAPSYPSDRVRFPTLTTAVNCSSAERGCTVPPRGCGQLGSRWSITGQRGSSPLLHVEAELDHVTVLHDVLFALHPGLSGRAGGGDGPLGHQILVRHDLGLDEALLEVRVDHPGGLRCGGALADGPGAGLLGAGGEERLQPERVEADAD